MRFIRHLSDGRARRPAPVPDPAVERLVAEALEHLDTLHRFAILLLRTPGDAADLVMETYVTFSRRADRYRRQSLGLRCWLLKTAREIYGQRWASQSWHPRESEGTSPIPRRTGARGISGALSGTTVKAAIDHLAPEHRMVLYLWGAEKLPPARIAAVMDLPDADAATRSLRRARALLIGYALRPPEPRRSAARTVT